MKIMKKKTAEQMWNKILSDPKECKWCVQTLMKHPAFCFYWLYHPDGKAHPICCLGICEYFERKDKTKENVGQALRSK